MRQRHMSDSDSDDRSGQGWAYTGAILGGAVSVAANVAHSYVPPTAVAEQLATGMLDHWAPHTGAVLSSIFWPVALFVGIETLARYPWPEGRRWVALRYGGLVPVMLVAAVVSYRHMSGLLHHYGEDPLTVAIGPLAVDGLMAMATGALIASGTRRKKRTATATPAATPTVAAPAARPATATRAPARPATRVAAAETPRPATVVATVAPKATAPRPKKAATRDSDNPLRQQARDMYAGGERHLATIALKVGTNKRNVERWTKDLRTASDTATAGGSDTADPEPAYAAN